jgi:hypothetical protein
VSGGDDDHVHIVAPDGLAPVSDGIAAARAGQSPRARLDGIAAADKLTLPERAGTLVSDQAAADDCGARDAKRNFNQIP